MEHNNNEKTEDLVKRERPLSIVSDRWFLSLALLNLYQNACVGVTYIVPSTPELSTRGLIQKHILKAVGALVSGDEIPLLSVVCLDHTSSVPHWGRLKYVDLQQVVEFIEIDNLDQGFREAGSRNTLEGVLEELHHQPFDYTSRTMPLWRIKVLLSTTSGRTSATIIFVWSHSMLDGMSGSIVSGTLSYHLGSTPGAVNNSEIPGSDLNSLSYVVRGSTAPLPVAMEDTYPLLGPKHTPIPILLQIGWQELKQSVLHLSPSYYFGKPIPFQISPTTGAFPLQRTIIKRLVVPSTTFALFKDITKQQNLSPTALIQSLLSFAVWLVIPESRAKHIHTAVPINARPILNLSSGDLTCGNYAAQVFHTFKKSVLSSVDLNALNPSTLLNKPNSPVLHQAQALSKKLGKKNMRVQAALLTGIVGLVTSSAPLKVKTGFNTSNDKYNKSRAASKEPREATVELSNLGVVKTDIKGWKVEDAFFSQSTGRTYAWTTVSTAITLNGDLSICWNWPGDEMDGSIGDKIRKVVEEAFTALVAVI